MPASLPTRGPDAALAAAAVEVLRGNDQGDYTRPSPRLYPHQWNWDSAFIALGWSWIDWTRAAREVESFLVARWRDGMLPHIRYNPQVTDYFPSPEMWGEVPVAQPGVCTSGISQPPVLPTAVYLVGLRHPDPAGRRAWWAGVYEPLRGWIAALAARRTLPPSPLIAVIHPWESGMDNSPRWDFAVRQGWRPQRPYRRRDVTLVDPALRPGQDDYNLYIFLVEQIAASGYDMAAYLPRAPFVVYDALFNAAWYRAAQDLNRIAEAIGQPPAVEAQALSAFRRAYHAALWSEEGQLFRDVDARTATQVPVDTAAGLAAIYGGLVDAAQAQTMVERYLRRSRGCRLLPSTLPDTPGFEPARYWRGPAWVNINWMVLRGLQALGLHDLAAQLRQATLDLVRAGGMAEYFHAHTGAGLGGEHFSWTAALTLDLLAAPGPVETSPV